MRALEDALRESGLEWAVLRPGGFASNALAWAESVRTQRAVAAPFGDVGVPVIDPADIAEVAAACLLDDRHTGGVYELTGPEVITPRQQAEAIAAELGSPVRFHELTRDEAKAAMTQFVAGGTRRRHPGHHRRPEPGRTADQPGRGTSPRPRPAPVQRLGRPQHRRFPLRHNSTEVPGQPRATRATATVARGAHLSVPPSSALEVPGRAGPQARPYRTDCCGAGHAVPHTAVDHTETTSAARTAAPANHGCCPPTSVHRYAAPWPSRSC